MSTAPARATSFLDRVVTAVLRPASQEVRTVLGLILAHTIARDEYVRMVEVGSMLDVRCDARFEQTDSRGDHPISIEVTKGGPGIDFGATDADAADVVAVRVLVPRAATVVFHSQGETTRLRRIA